MGRTRRQRQQQEKALEALLTRAAQAGVEQGRQESFLSILTRIARRLLLADARDAARMVLEEGPQTAIRRLGRLAGDVWAGRWQESLGPILEEVMDTTPLQTDRGPVRLGFDLASPALGEYFAGYVDRLGRDLSETSRGNAEKVIREATAEGLSVPDTADRLQERLGEINRSRAELISRNELHRASVSASEIQACNSGVVQSRTWLSSADERVRPAHRVLNGVTVGLDEEFPGGIRSPAEEVACRCTLIFGINLDAVRRRAA